MSSSPFPVLSEIQMLRARLAVSEAQLNMSKKQIQIVNADLHRRYCHNQLAMALMAFKTEHNYCWDDYRSYLEAPCSVEMLKSIALNRKHPSAALYTTLCTCLKFAAIRNGYLEPVLPTLEGAS